MKKIDVLDEQQLIDTLSNAGAPCGWMIFLRLTGFSRRLKRDVVTALHDLARNGEAVRLPGGAWVMASAMKTRRGKLAIQRFRRGLCHSEGDVPHSGKDIYIAPEYVATPGTAIWWMSCLCLAEPEETKIPKDGAFRGGTRA
jgi:hypothetical protein